MKWKQLETVPARTPKTDAYMATAEELGNVLILDVWENRERKFRYCIDVETGQHGYLEETWSRGKLLTALATNPNHYWPKDVRYPSINRKENAVLEQYEDYLSMCQATGKDLTDEMVYRPRELKRRHDEVIVDQQQMQILREMSRDSEQREAYAREMREKYPTAEQTLQEIRERYEYENGEYKIIVPQTLMDIVLEGRALHHCVGSSERYFDRIEDRETYICFLRRQSAPGVPFYTIEVEPGGTIRQHRSYLDEEPGIEEIRGFLREWQKVLKSRLTWKDRELARTSKIKREQNIEELKAKRNTRVLKGLEEDFLEAEAAGWN